jgi:hypothetical protein
MHDLVEIGVFGDAPGGGRQTLYLQKHRVRSGANRVVVKVAQQPREAGIDPRNLLIDTQMDDNVVRVGQPGA